MRVRAFLRKQRRVKDPEVVRNSSWSVWIVSYVNDKKFVVTDECDGKALAEAGVEVACAYGAFWPSLMVQGRIAYWRRGLLRWFAPATSLERSCQRKYERRMQGG
jgi:hypothetical protein